MARCGCSGRTCNCLVQGGQGINITGSGTADDPYIIVATTDVDISDAIRFVDTTSVNFTVTGSGTASDPWTVTAIAELGVAGLSDVACESPSPNDVLSWDGTNWVCAPVSVEAGAINTADPITGDGTVGAPISFAPTVLPPLSGVGSAAEPLAWTPVLDETSMSGAGTVESPLTSKVPYSGHVVIRSPGTTQNGSRSITFPAGRFADIPVVVVTPGTSAPNNVHASQTGVTVAGATIVAYRSDGIGQTTVSVQASDRQFVLNL